MANYLVMASIVPSLVLLLGWLLPAPAANRGKRLVGRVVSTLVGMQCVAAAATLACHAAGAIAPTTTLRIALPDPWAWSVRYDGVSGLALLLVSFVGLAVCRYSVRYLDGDPRQGDYFRWVGATIGGVSVAIVAGNLAWLVVVWMATSMALHRLLLHFPDRPGAQRAAWTKFATSRVGDVFLLTALVLIYRTFGTLELDPLFAASGAEGWPASAGAEQSWIGPFWIGITLVLGAAAKSAQFPLHGWLPQTLETPTPVSALMHAGVVNAGGYLIIRTSPLLVASPASLALLAVIGVSTVAVGGVAMMTQPSVKTKLAYSTVAQMGFMMLQCGLGAFSAAMLHLVAHSLYKAYAFLNSGSVLREARSMATDGAATPQRQCTAVEALLTLMAVSAGFVAVAWAAALPLAGKPGGMALAAVLCLALTLGVLEALATRRAGLAALALAAAMGVAALYAAAYLGIDALVGADTGVLASGTLSLAVGELVVAVFVGLFFLTLMLRLAPPRRWLEPTYVHALNGFYIDALYARAIGPLMHRR